MHINEIDLNLLRLFDAVYRTRNVSRAAELLDLTQPAASQGLTRLRALIHDPLFMRASGGVQPTPKADRLAEPVRLALVTIEQALSESDGFEPLQSRRTLPHPHERHRRRALPAGADDDAAAAGAQRAAGDHAAAARPRSPMPWTAAGSTWPSGSCRW